MPRRPITPVPAMIDLLLPFLLPMRAVARRMLGCLTLPRRLAVNCCSSVRDRGRVTGFSSSSTSSSNRGGITYIGSGAIGWLGPSPSRFGRDGGGSGGGEVIWLFCCCCFCKCLFAAADIDGDEEADVLLAILDEVDGSGPSHPSWRYLNKISLTLSSTAPRQSNILASVIPSSPSTSSWQSILVSSNC